jgi:hypothetical protein
VKARARSYDLARLREQGQLISAAGLAEADAVVVRPDPEIAERRQGAVVEIRGAGKVLDPEGQMPEHPRLLTLRSA